MVINPIKPLKQTQTSNKEKKRKNCKPISVTGSPRLKTHNHAHQ